MKKNCLGFYNLSVSFHQNKFYAAAKKSINETLVQDKALFLEEDWTVIYIRSVKLVSFWGPHCIYEQSCRGPHEIFDLEITTSLGNDFCNVARSKINLQKKKDITFSASVKLSPNDKNLYLSSVACDLGFKRLFDDDPLQYCRNSLVILESSGRPH